MTDHGNNTLLQRMFRNACSFAEIAYLCETEKTPHSLPIDSYSVPGIVNSAFSCEVFLKSLLVYQGSSLKDVKADKHYLHKLWEKYEQKNPSNASQIEMQVIRNYKRGDSGLFKKKLQEISNSFYDWRYVYEDKKRFSADRNFMRFFRNALRDNCCMIYYNQTWNEFVTTGFNWYDK